MIFEGGGVRSLKKNDGNSEEWKGKEEKGKKNVSKMGGLYRVSNK